jgi:hypothetical protein
VGPEFEIMVAQMCKFKEGGGLGISLEGTVEKVDGAEQNPHHYIRSGYGSTFWDFVTILTEGSIQDNTVARLQSIRVQTPLSPSLLNVM